MTKKLKIILTTSSTLLGVGVLAGTIVPIMTKKINNNIISSSSTTKITNNFASTSTSNTVTINNIKYSLNSTTYDASVDGYASIPSAFMELTIPSYINVNGIDYSVTAISNGAFMNSNISSLSLPSSLLTIGNLSFANNYLTSLSIPANVSSIGKNAFSNNMFNYGSRVFLPVNCVWNKAYGTSSFDTDNNYSVFSPCMQFVIQGSAVYTYNPNQNGYVVTSYMPKEIYQQEKNNIQEVVNNSSGASAIITTPDDTSNPNYTSNSVDDSLNNQPVLLSSLSQTALSFNGLSDNGTSGWVTFDTKTMTMNYIINSKHSSNEVYDSAAGTTFALSMYNPNNNTYVISQQNQPGWQSSTNFAKLWQGKSFAYGDIITFTTPTSWLNPKGMSNALFNISTNYYNGISASGLNAMYIYNRSWSGNKYGTASFRITPLGLIPYVNTTVITNNSLNVITPNFNGDFTITGNSTPNATVYATIGSSVYSTIANSTGAFSISITGQKDLTTSSTVLISSSTSPGYYAHFEGANPNGAVLVFDVAGTNFGITFNGLINGLDLWYQTSNRNFADYETPYFVSQASTLSSSTWVQNDNSTLTFVMTYSNEEKPVTTVISFDNGMELSTLTKQINAIPIANLINVQVLCHNVNLTYVFNNQRMQKIGYNFVGKASSYVFSYSIANGLVSTYVPKNSNGSVIWTQTNNTTIGVADGAQYAMTPFSVYGSYSGGWNAKYYLGVYHTDKSSSITYQIGSNWYDPTPMMYDVAHSLIAGISNPVTQAVQIVRWVSNNYHYDQAIQYHMNYSLSAAQEFHNTQGICGNYSSLSAMLLSLDGFVARIVTGSVITPTLFSANLAIDHAWVQVWIPSYGEWITLDPTFGWYGNPGNNTSLFALIRSSENVTNYIFPPYKPNDPQTLFSSYFSNAPWQELSYFGNYYGIMNGQGGFMQSPYTVASIAALFDNQAKLMKDIDYASDYSNPNNFWTISIKNNSYLNGIYGYSK